MLLLIIKQKHTSTIVHTNYANICKMNVSHFNNERIVFLVRLIKRYYARLLFKKIFATCYIKRALSSTSVHVFNIVIK